MLNPVREPLAKPSCWVEVVEEGAATCVISPALLELYKFQLNVSVLAPSARPVIWMPVTLLAGEVRMPAPSNVSVPLATWTGFPLPPTSAAGIVMEYPQELAAFFVNVNVSTWLVPRES